MLDTIIRGGTIVDGSGQPSYRADIGIEGDRIAAIGRLDGIEAASEIDAQGDIVSPGFIDIHTHSDFTLLVNGNAESQVHQGVTFEAIGNCGHSCAPVIGSPDRLKPLIVGHHDCVEITWRSFADYLEKLESAPLGVNVAAFVGHGPLRVGVLEGAQRPSTQEETRAMEKLLEQSLEEGAIGFTTGLEYAPGSASRTEEVLSLCEVTARHDRLYATHVRNRDFFYEQGIGEALAVARRSGVKTQLSHITPKFGAPPHATEHALEMIEWTRDSGCDLAFDAIPNEWGPTLLSAVLPPWAFEGGIPNLLQRLADPAVRADMKRNPLTIWKLVLARKWDQLILFRSTRNPQYIGLNFEKIGELRGVDPHDAILDLLQEEGEQIYDATWVGHIVSEADLDLTLLHPDCAVMSDTITLAPYGELADVRFSPASYGWTAKWLGLYARERGLVGLEEAVRRITSLPAARLGLTDRGHLRVGAHADITVFRWEDVKDRSSLAEPNLYPIGFRQVLVNGQLALREGKRTDANGGYVVRGRG
ncbi:MAG: amidohydrolase family protein [Kiloniellales bacterium]